MERGDPFGLSKGGVNCLVSPNDVPARLKAVKLSSRALSGSSDLEILQVRLRLTKSGDFQVHYILYKATYILSRAMA
jgi:hypothetical protein